MDIETFRDHMREYLRSGGYHQNELARAINLHPKVLSRKLHGNANAYLTQREVRDILAVFAQWHVITTRDEVLRLLDVAGVDPRVIDADEWRLPPFNELSDEERSPTDIKQPARTPQHNLPASITHLVGRTWAVERLQELLGKSDARLVTLVGPGGSGKTALALHVARELASAFAQGAWFVPLAGLSDPTLVPISILQALNLNPSPSQTPLQRLSEYLREKHILLVLDNFEHLGDARTIISTLLATASKLKVLLTSRVVQHLYGEREFRVPPLDVPDLRMQLATGNLAQYGAIQLFLERAQAVLPDFTLTDANASLIARICALVDGLPLALELAAARVKMLPPEGLFSRLTQARLSLLTGGARNLPDRQQTLRKTLDWSYTLLAPDEKIWFRRLGVFTGGWELEAAEALMREMAAAEEKTPDPLDLLEQLVDHSLITRMPGGHGLARFTMLETLREYAIERLTEQREYEKLRDWHACYHLRIAEKAELGLRGPHQLTHLAQLQDEQDNFRAALEWSLHKAREGQAIHAFAAHAEKTGEHNRPVAGSKTLSTLHNSSESTWSALEYALRLATALRHGWEWQGNLIEGRYWLNAALEIPLAPDSGKTVLAARARALSEAARLVFLQNEQERALELAEESIALWRQLEDPPGLATALLHRGWVAHGMGEYDTARQMYQEGLDLLSPDEEGWLYAQLLVQMAAAAGFASDFAQTQLCYTRCREIFTRLGDKSALADVLKDQGSLLILESRYEESIACLLESIRLCRAMNHRQYLATALGSLSFAFGLREQPDPESASLASAQIQGASDSLMETIGLTPWTRTNRFTVMVRQHIQSRVSEQDWQTAWEAGYAPTLDEALELAYRLGEG